MNLDQASSLRKLMNETQQVKASPVAILSTSDSVNLNDSIVNLANSFSRKTQRLVSIVGLEGEQKLLNSILENRSNDEMIERLSLRVSKVQGSLSFISKIKEDKKLFELFVKKMEELENDNDTLLYHVGKGMDTTTINLSIMSKKVLVFMKPSSKSLMELTNYVKIFSKMGINNQIGIVMDTKDERFFKEQVKKIQELYWKQFKYYIEPIGFYDSKKIGLKENDQFLYFNYDYLLSKREKTTFSETLKKML